jgi:predicted metal-binding protein
MAGTVTADVFESPALTFLLQLQAHGFEIQVVEPDILRVRPVDRVTPELRIDLQRYKAALLMLIRIGDAGVQDRREAFARQLKRPQADVLVSRLMFREAPYVNGSCHACGDALEGARWGSCWRCSLARRLACHAAVPADLFAAYDEARICT